MKYAKRIAQRVIEDQAFVVDSKEKILHSFNPVASRIWQMVGRGAEAQAIARALAEEFDVTEAQAKADVREFLDKLVAMKLLDP